MKDKKRTTDASACIHCHLCQKHCVFLKKYQMDIGDTDRLLKLAYHCFLCGKCSEVCPKGIDGREIILDMRRKQAEENKGRPGEKGYGMLLAEKKNYVFANYKNTMGKRVLFPGCNFPSFYPETTKYLADLLRERYGIGTVFDCCGKPVAELGMKQQEEKIINRIEERFLKTGVEEVIMVCPNCYAFLKPRLCVKVVSIYEVLRELGVGQMIDEELSIFLPCPDREEKEMFSYLAHFLKKEPEFLSNVQCCGLGGCAGVKEPEIAGQMLQKAGKETTEQIWTYCASCAGNFRRKGYEHTEHILVKILGRKEKPDTGKSMINRMRMKYWRMNK